jgi:hypothetical protein
LIEENYINKFTKAKIREGEQKSTTVLESRKENEEEDIGMGEVIICLNILNLVEQRYLNA